MFNFLNLKSGKNKIALISRTCITLYFFTHPVPCVDVGLRLQAQCTERVILKLLMPVLAGCVLHVPQSLPVNNDGRMARY